MGNFIVQGGKLPSLSGPRPLLHTQQAPTRTCGRMHMASGCVRRGRPPQHTNTGEPAAWPQPLTAPPGSAGHEASARTPQARP